MKKKRIGIVIESMHGVYQGKIAEKLIEQTEGKEVDLVFFCGLGILDINGKYEVHSAVLKLASRPAIDGLVLVMTSFTNYIDTDWVDKLIEDYQDIPKVVFGYRYNGIPNVWIDNENSMEEMVEYLINEVRCKTIGYISGPLTNLEARARYQGYLIALNNHEIEIDKQFFYEGFFIEQSGKEAIEKLIKSKMELPDAIVCANDEMALGASHELVENGLSIPFNIKVTGFDNILESTFDIPLTTIDQPIDQMIEFALDSLDCQFFGREIIYDYNIPGKLIVRESSYLENETESTLIRIGDLNRVQDNVIGAYIDFENEVNSQIVNLANIFFEKEKINTELEEIFKQMIKSLLLDIKEEISKGKFLNKCLLLSKLLIKKIPYNVFNNRYNKFKTEIVGLTRNSQLYNRLQEIFYDSSLVINNYFYSIENVKLRKLTDRYIMSRSFVNVIMASKDFKELKSNLIDRALSNDINEFFVTIFSDIVINEDLNRDSHISDLTLPVDSYLFMGIKNGKLLKSTTFKTDQLLAESIIKSKETKRLIVLELYREGQHYGHLTMNLNRVDLQIYETIRLAISIKLFELFGKGEKLVME